MDPTINKIEATYRELVAQGRSIVKLFSGNPNDEGFTFPSEVLEDAYARYFKTQGYHPHPKGLLKAREAIARYYEAHDSRVDPENILLTAGTSESFFYLFSLLAKPGDNILAPNPAYPLFDYIADLAGVELRHYPLDEERNWAIDVKSLCQKIDARTRAIILISPNNPTGAVASAEEIRAIADEANARGIPLICDEVFSEFYFGTGSFPRALSAARPDLCFTLNGISKMFALPALKLGWIAVTGRKARIDAAVDRLETTADTFLSCHIPIQEALPEIFARGQPFLNNYKREVRRRRDLSVELLRGVPGLVVVEPLGGFYLMAKVARVTGHSEEEFVIRLMRDHGVFVHPGYFFDYEKGIHLIISFLTAEERLRKGLEGVREFMSSP